MATIFRIGTPNRSLAEPAGLWQRGFRTISHWWSRAAQRRQLRNLAQDPHLLRDLGLSAADARREARKQFWRP